MESFEYNQNALKEASKPKHSIWDGFLARIDKAESSKLGYILVFVVASLLPSCKVVEAAHKQPDYSYAYETTQEEWDQMARDREFERGNKASIGLKSKKGVGND